MKAALLRLKSEIRFDLDEGKVETLARTVTPAFDALDRDIG